MVVTEKDLRFRPTPHPVLRLPTREQGAAMGEQALREFLARREELIIAEKHDPLRSGYEPESFKKFDELIAKYRKLLLLGGNRLGKTVKAAKHVVRRLVDRPAQLWICFHSSERSSIEQQQSIIHSILPPEWRDLGSQGTETYVKYKKANGFANFKFILPNGSTCLFFNYKQDVSVMEGYEIDGVWFDELVPLSFIEALEFRLGRDRPMEQIITFTPVLGYSPVVGRYLAGADVVETARAELLPADIVHAKGCPPGHMPLVMRGRRPDEAVLFFHWGSNPFSPNDELRRELAHAPLGKIKIRAYGYAEKLIGNAFPKYVATHRISRARFEDLARKGGTRYCVADPGGTKNWFVKWYFVTPEGWVIVYREWPDHAHYGEWAIEPSNDRPDWRPGPAQRSESGRGIREYKKLILGLEGHRWNADKKVWDESKAEKIHLRLIDPRMGGMEVPGADEGTSIIAMMEEEQRDASGAILTPRMFWDQAPASRVDESIQMINDLLDYDDEQPVNVLNCPRWYVVDDLLQSHLAYTEFTALGTDKDALKDIIDPDRYFVKAGLGYVDTHFRQARRSGHY